MNSLLIVSLLIAGVACQSYSFYGLVGPKKCSTIIDCGSSQLCVDGKCVVDNGYGGLCSSDAYCPNGFICIDGKCEARRRFGYLPCVAPCNPGQACINGVCISLPIRRWSAAMLCTDSVQCPDNRKCIGGSCF